MTAFTTSPFFTPPPGIASFTAAGDRIVERHADGTPAKAVHVRYRPRASSDKLEPLTLSYLDNGEPFDVK